MGRLWKCIPFTKKENWTPYPLITAGDLVIMASGGQCFGKWKNARMKELCVLVLHRSGSCVRQCHCGCLCGNNHDGFPVHSWHAHIDVSSEHQCVTGSHYGKEITIDSKICLSPPSSTLPEWSDWTSVINSNMTSKCFLIITESDLWDKVPACTFIEGTNKQI